MKEISFIRTNIDKWKDAELVVEGDVDDSPDRLSDVYIDLTSDLAFAQSHFPNSRVVDYLNSLCAALHQRIYSTKRERWSRIITFWTREVPDCMYENRKLLLFSFCFFLLSVLIGVVSQLLDPDYCETILGPGYVNMTLENIEKGKPVDVYSSDSEIFSFLGITLNNIKVSFLIFVSGILTSIATLYMLFYNSVMIGCLETLFFQHGCLVESLLAVFLHGTLELSAIIIAAAAGLALGNSWLFPGTYSRIASFRRGAKRGLKIIVGTVPIFIVAGFIESFLTRHTEIPDALRLTIILLSLLFVIGYFVLLPIHRNHKKINNDLQSRSEDSLL